MQQSKVTILISNFNYADFLGEAIHSALEQRYPATEVIVVDDGSTDRSRQIIEGFGDRIRAIFKENGGQTSALNLGYRAARGEIVFFLDADDALRPDTVETVVAAMRPGVAAVQFCLATIDRDGRPLGGIYPPLPPDWSPARIRDCVLRSGFYPCPPTSGNAYARWFLDRVMPVPPERIPGGTDGALNTVAPLYGDVVVLKEPLGLYRIHGRNIGALAELEPEKFSYFVDLDMRRGAYLVETAHRLGFPLQEAVLDRAFFYLQYRVASCKLRPDLHPIARDRLWRLPWMLARAAAQAPDRVLLRAFVVLWGFAVALAPRPLAHRLVEMRFISGSRPKLLDGVLRRLGLVRRTRAKPDPSFAGGKPARAAEYKPARAAE
jgi:glycosyltransferase involved in cell wall biosynthesis